MARRSRLQPVAPVTWRDGVHITGTPIWCDARRRRDVCFVSSADRVGKTGHGQLIGTPATLALLGGGTGDLAVPLHRPFTLGTLRLELIDAGRTFGAAALHVAPRPGGRATPIDDTGAIGARGVLYAGEVRGNAEVRTCDAVVVTAAIDRALPAVADVERAVVAWTRGKLAQQPRLVVDTPTDGLELVQRLAAAAIPVAGSRALRDAAKKLKLPEPRAKAPCATVLVEREARGGTAPTAIVSPRDGAQFAWPFVADRAQLLEWIEQTGARDVYLTGPRAEALAAAVGTRAKVLGPPTQMSLFRG